MRHPISYIRLIELLEYSPSNFIRVHPENRVTFHLQIMPDAKGRPICTPLYTYFRVTWPTLFKLLLNKIIRATPNGYYSFKNGKKTPGMDCFYRRTS